MKKILFIILFLVNFARFTGQGCVAVPVPFLQSFSSGGLPTCWTSQNPSSNSTNANVKWKFSGLAGHGATGHGGKPAGTFAWVDASSPYADEHTVELISPQINLTGLSNPYVKFEWFKDHLTGLNGTVPAADHNQMKLSVNDGSGWVQVWSDDTNSPTWRTVGVPLATNYVGTTIQLKFTVDKDVAGNGNFYDHVLLDEVQVIQAPTCFEPVTLPASNITPTSATLNWAAPLAPAPAPANGYEYYYSTNSTPPAAATPGTPNPGISANISSLTSGATYYWWIRSVCSATAKSQWIAGAPFISGQIGGGTANQAFLPVYSCSRFNYSQQIYTASEIGAAVGTNNYITAIRFFVSTSASTQANYNQWVVYMGNTTQADFPTNTSWIPSTSLTQVYSGNLPTMTAGTWVEIPLSTPFLWDGVSNIVIGVDENSTGTSCTANWGSYPAGNNRGIIYYSYNTNPEPANPPIAASRYNVLPRIQLTGTTLPSCTNIPPSNIAVNNITATSANVTWTITANATYVIRYRTSPSLTWQTVNVTNPFINSITLTSLTEQTQYEVEIATICGTQGAFSAPVGFTTPALTYCNASTATVTNGYINNITMAGTNVPLASNNSGPTTYTDYSTDPAKTITLLRNSVNNTLSVGRSIISGTYSTNAWIDFNGDGIFDNNPATSPGGERIMNLDYSNTTPVMATFDVPANAYLGTSKVKMRVIVYSLIPVNACGPLISNGEVEDYYVKFIDLQPCTNAATSVTVNNLTHNSAYVSWIPANNATYVIRWRQGNTGAWLPDATGQTIPAGQSFYTITGLTEQTGYQVQISTICGTQGTFSAPVSFTTPALTYCNATTATVTNGYINNITMTGTNVPLTSNNSGPTTYTDYSTDPTKTITLLRNSVNNKLSVGRSIISGTYSTNAWIDFNGDGIFDNNPATSPGGERIMNLGYSSTTPVTATFDVPANAYLGTSKVKMRVIVYSLTPANACGPFTSNGEVEDYYVKFIDLQPCTTAAPTNITVNNIHHNSANVSWIPASNATYVIRWRQGSTGAWLPSATGHTLPAGQSFYTITGLIDQTIYQVQIATICNGNQGGFSPSTNFTTIPLTYCSMTGTAINEFISNVKVTPINFPIMDNISVQTNYISYTTPVTLINLEIGSQGNQLSVSKEWMGTQYANAVNAWIDWDRDGVFTDAEKIMTSAASTTTPVTNTFDVPSTGVYTGPLTTTMRVVLKRNSAPVMCADAANGEVEDYTVRLRPCSNTTPGNPVFTNITHNSVNINWTTATNNNAFILEYRPVTNPVSAWVPLNLSVLGGNPPVTINALTPATTYEVRIAAVCGGTGIGVYTPIKTFTTRCDPTPPFVTISNVTSNSALITWNPVVPSASYILRWREVGTGPWNTPAIPQPPANSYTIQNLDSFKTYEVQVANICNGETTANPWSNTKIFTTERSCEIPPQGLMITQIFPTTAEVVWDPFPGATYILKYRKVGIPSWTEVVVPTNTYTITGLLELTKYEMQVANICNGVPGNFTKLYYFTTPTVIYCPMSAANSTTEFISKVTVKPIRNKEMINESPASTYSDFTGNPLQFIDLIQGSKGNQITIDKTLSSGTKAGVAVWIDFNRNGEFDINERILADGPNGNPTANTTFSVPDNAFISMTDYKYVVMRVALQKDGIPVNCTSFKDGEVEDYKVRISKQPVPNSLNQADIHIYPNPVSSVLYVKNISAKAQYKIYSAVGRLISSGIILNNAIDVSNLIDGIYIIDIEDGGVTVQKKLIKES